MEPHTDFPVIDSHIHLYAASHIPTLNWTADLPSNHPLNRQSSVTEYRTATSNRANLLGFVFLETDRKSGLNDNQWHDALEEVSYLARIARGTPNEGEGHNTEDKSLVLGVVPWAPVPAGRAALEGYMNQVRGRCGSAWSLIKGVRYLVQDKPIGTMLQPDFVDGLRWLGENGFAFDLGVDARSGGVEQLRETSEMMKRIYANGTGPKIVINHFCKPNLRLSRDDVLHGHADFEDWKRHIRVMASYKSTYMKLSGFFSELLSQDAGVPTEVETLLETTKPWVDAVFAEFGPSRIMYGSDWPVCTMGGPGITKSWNHWYELVTALLADQKLSKEEKASIWCGTAVEAYNITLP